MDKIIISIIFIKYNQKLSKKIFISKKKKMHHKNQSKTFIDLSYILIYKLIQHLEFIIQLIS